jgi:hypothetical protein
MKLTKTQLEYILSKLETECTKHAELRRGQTFFNLLYQIAPKIANEVKGTEIDCYHADSKIELIIQAKFDNEAVQYFKSLPQ